MGVTKTRAMTAVGVAAVTAGITLGITSAVASVAGHLSADLNQCGLNLARCGTPLVYRPFKQPLGLQAAAKRVNAPVVIQEASKNQPLQDWTYQSLGLVSALTAAQRSHLGVTAYDSRTYAHAWIVRLELTPMGKKSGLCAAKARAALVLQTCDDGINQTFIQAKLVNRVWAIVGYFGLSMAQDPGVAGHHLTATGSYRRGKQVTFAVAKSSDLQYWWEVPQATPSPTPRRTKPTCSYYNCQTTPPPPPQ